MLSFVEAFWVMGVIFWGMAPLVVLLKNAQRPASPHASACAEGKKGSERPSWWAGA